MQTPSPTILTAEAQVLRFAANTWLAKPGEVERGCGQLLSEWADRAEADANEHARDRLTAEAGKYERGV